jgi:LPXTG-motif cell wall-anchored protein
MKKSVFLFVMTALLLFGGTNKAFAQEQPKPKKDTVNMDTDAKPQTYYAIEDEKAKDGDKGSSSTIIIVIGAVVIVGAAAFLLLKKKK